MRCLRTSFPRSSQYLQIRRIHTTRISYAESGFTDDPDESFPSPLSNPSSDRDVSNQNTIRDELAYARQINERGLRRCQESQEPKGKVQFMTMGREFAIPYNLTQLSYMSLNHMRELRSYYRKIMYEMPQFKRMYSVFYGG